MNCFIEGALATADLCTCSEIHRKPPYAYLDGVLCQAPLLHDPQPGPVSVLPQLVLELRHI